MSIFNAGESTQRKNDGMALAADNRKEDLAAARVIAEELGAGGAWVTADDVGRELYERHGIKTLGPAAGTLFKGKRWVWTGTFKPSKRITNHARLLRVWQLREYA